MFRSSCSAGTACAATTKPFQNATRTSGRSAPTWIGAWRPRSISGSATITSAGLAGDERNGAHENIYEGDLTLAYRLVHLVCLVALVYLVQPNKRDRPNRPDRRDRPNRPNNRNELFLRSGTEGTDGLGTFAADRRQGPAVCSGHRIIAPAASGFPGRRATCSQGSIGGALDGP